MSEFITPQKLKEFGRDYVKILTRELLRARKDATGQLIRSLNYKIVEDAEIIRIEILSAPYLEWVDKGRKRGTYPPIKPLIQWANIKGLPEQAAWAVRQNIFKFGIKPTNVIQRVVNEFETSPTLKKRYEDEVVNSIIKNINDKYKEI
jgi:hypothetical protein